MAQSRSTARINPQRTWLDLKLICNCGFHYIRLLGMTLRKCTLALLFNAWTDASFEVIDIVEASTGVMTTPVCFMIGCFEIFNRIGF